MKNYLIISLLFLSLGYSQKEYNINDLIDMDNGLWTIKFSDEPITGKVYGYFGEEGNLKKVYMGKLLNGRSEGKFVDYYHSTGRKSLESYFKDGKRHGLHTSWYENGQKEYEGNFKDEKKDGLHTSWYENGQKKEEKNFKDDKLNGLWTEWYENGQKSKKFNYKDGEFDGLITEWYENGKKSGEINFKNGKKDGLTTLWYENGKKEYEGNFKNDKLISSKKWNEDGSVKE